MRASAPGAFDLAASGWFYGIWICLLLILIILILILVGKKYTDKNWEEKGHHFFSLHNSTVMLKLITACALANASV